MANQQESLHFLDYWRVIRSRKEVVIAVSLLVVITGILVTYSMPKAYMASSLIQVKADSPDVDVFQQEIMRYDPLYLRTQFEVIQSAPVVEEVVRKLGLTERLGRAYGYLEALGDRAFDETVKLISKSMRVQQYRDTNLIEVQIYLNELGGAREAAPDLAAQIADAIVVAYRNQSLQRSNDNTRRALEALNEALQEQQVRVEEAESRVADIREQYKIDIIASPGTRGADTALEKISMTHLEASRIKTRLELEDKRARYETVRGLTPQQLRDAGPYLVQDPALPTLIAEKRSMEVQLNDKLEVLGPNHPEVTSMKAGIAEIDRKIEDALNGLKMGVRTDYEAAKAKFKAVEAELERLKASERTAESSEYRQFNQAVEDLEHAKDIRDALEMRYLQENIEQRIPRTTVEVIQKAKAPPLDDPVKPNVPLNVALSVIFGLAAGVALAYFIEYLDTSVKTIEDIESSMGVSVLGVIPQKVKPLVDDSAESAHAEAYRVLRTNLQFAKNMNKGKSFCVTSGSVGEGKSLTLFNLAYVCAQLGDRVLVIDSDLHRPRQHRILGLSNSEGLATILMGKADLDQVVVDTPLDNLKFLPSGRLPSGSHGLLGTDRMVNLVKEAKSRFDVVFLDSPPIIGVSDASMLVRIVDGVLLIIQHRKYPRAISSRAKDMIGNVGGNLLGVILNNINISRDHTYYYYQQHYYYYPRGSKQKRRKRRDERE